MNRGGRKASSSNIYHVVKRGVCKADIFKEDSDRSCILSYLKPMISKEFKIHAYCLMGNHLHLLVEAISVETLSVTMKILFSSYVRYFNRKYDRDGSIFKGRFWSRPIDTQRYFMSCLRYILRNPIDIGVTNYFEYKWSSVRSYHTADPGIVTTKLVCSMFPDRNSLKAFLKSDDDLIAGGYKESMSEKKQIRDGGLSDRKKIINYIRRKYNIYNLWDLSIADKCEIIANVHKTMPDIPLIRFEESLKINRRTITRYLQK